MTRRRPVHNKPPNLPVTLDIYSPLQRSVIAALACLFRYSMPDDVIEATLIDIATDIKQSERTLGEPTCPYGLLYWDSHVCILNRTCGIAITHTSIGENILSGCISVYATDHPDLYTLTDQCQNLAEIFAIIHGMLHTVIPKDTLKDILVHVATSVLESQLHTIHNVDSKRPQIFHPRSTALRYALMYYPFEMDVLDTWSMEGEVAGAMKFTFDPTDAFLSVPHRH